jgi:hypothetical protein
MTFLGKIFSTILLLLSAAFMVLALVANASHRNWRDAVLDPSVGLKRKVEEGQQVTRQLADSRMRAEAALAREQASRRTALAALQSQVDNLRQQLQAREQAVQSLQAMNNELVQTDKSRAEQLASLTEANKNLESKIIAERTDRDQLFAKSLELTDLYNQALGVLDTLSKVNSGLLADVSRYKEVLDARGINANDPLDGSPPDRNGVVLAVNRPNKLIEISIGFDEGLRDGHTLRVTRGGRYLGKVKVRKTEPDKSVAEILDAYLEGPIQAGDRVDTTLE